MAGNLVIRILNLFWLVSKCARSFFYVPSPFLCMNFQNSKTRVITTHQEMLYFEACQFYHNFQEEMLEKNIIKMVDS